MKIITPFFLIILLTLISCNPSEKESGDFKILPLPQYQVYKGIGKLIPQDVTYVYCKENIPLPVRGALLSHLEPVRKKALSQVICSIDSSIDVREQGYILKISKKRVVVTGRDQQGLFYGLMTLEQIMRDAIDQDIALPLCHIEDYPLLSWRAIHLDLKHHREKLDYYYRLIDKLASYKINAIIAEMEDKLGYVRQPEVASDDAISIEEWRALSDYAQERNIEISPLIQGLGHASFILKHDKYKHLRDDPKDDWAFNPLDPETYEVQFDLYRDAMEAIPYGRYLHVGGDEVHTTGRNSGMSSLELQLIWLNKVCEFAAQHDRIPVFWDDMPIKYAGLYQTLFDTAMTREVADSLWKKNEYKLLEFLDRFPQNCIYMRWNYKAPASAGNLRAMEWFMGNGLKVMGATAGQTTWILMPQNESNMDNINAFAKASVDYGIDGLLLTLWDDSSPHFELYMRGIISFAEYTWSGKKRDKSALKSAYRQREFSHALSDDAYAFIDLLEKPVEFWNGAFLKKKIDRRDLVRMDDPIDEGLLELPDVKSKGAWVEKYQKRLEEAELMLERCDSVSVIIEAGLQRCERNCYTLQVYQQVNEMVCFAPEVLLALKAFDRAPGGEEEAAAFEVIMQITEKFEDIKTAFEEVYSVTRLISKPDNYILDQNLHRHLANQAISFEWQYYPETLMMQKIRDQYIK